MTGDASGGTKRRRQLAVAGIAVVAASALAWALLARSPGLPRDRTVWFRAESPAALRNARPEICDAPDGVHCGFVVLEFDGSLRPCTEVVAVAETRWVQRIRSRLGLPSSSPERTSLVALSSVTTSSGTWVECAADLTALGPDWRPADLAGVWIVDFSHRGPNARVEIRPDGTMTDTARPIARRLGTWAERRGDLYFLWEAAESDGRTNLGQFGLSADRRSVYGRNRARWDGGRRE